MNRARAGTLLIVCLVAGIWASKFRAQQASSAELQHYFQEGHKALAEKRFADAEKAFGKLVQLDPTAAIPYANLALVYFEERKFSDAVPAFQKSLKLDPGLSNSRYFLAMSLSELGRYGEALKGVKEGFDEERDPKLKRLIGLHLERTYTGLGRDREAVTVALEMSRLYPNDPEVLYQTGRLCGNFAYLSIRKLGQVAPGSIWRHMASGDFYETQGHYALAIREYRQVVALNPRMPGIHYRLGRALLRSKQPGAQAEALKEFQAELRLDPTNANAAYQAAEIYRNLDQLDRAHDLLTAALKQHPNFEEGELGFGRLLNLQGKPRLALPHLQKAVSLDPDDAAAFFQLARAYRALGNKAGEAQAMAQFQKLKAQQASRENALAEDSPR